MQVAQRNSGLPDLFGANRLSSDALDAIFKPEESFLWDYVSTLEAPVAQQDDRSTVTSVCPEISRWRPPARHQSPAGRLQSPKL